MNIRNMIKCLTVIIVLTVSCNAMAQLNFLGDADYEVEKAKNGNYTCRTDKGVYGVGMQIQTNFYFTQRKPEGSTIFPSLFSMEMGVSVKINPDIYRAQQSVFKALAKLDANGKGHEGQCKLLLDNEEVIPITAKVFDYTKTVTGQVHGLAVFIIFTLAPTTAKKGADLRECVMKLRKHDINEIEIEGITLNIKRLEYYTGPIIDNMCKELIKAGCDSSSFEVKQ